MRLTFLLILLVLIAICAAKSSKSKSHKTTKSKTSKVIETKKHKDVKHKDAGKKLKTESKQHDSKKKEKGHKAAVKTSSNTVADKSSNKTSDDKITNTNGTVVKKENSTKATLLKNPPADCQKIVDEYSDGKILMYEYKIQMGRCLKKAKEGEKKMQVPGYQAPIVPMLNSNMPAQQPEMPGQRAASFYPSMDQTQYNAASAQSPAPVPQQSQAAFAPSPMNQYAANPAPFQPADPNMMNAVAKSDVPENAQPQAPASQANAVFDQWRASSFADKKVQTSDAPVAPANDQFAEFMKMQSASSSNAEPLPASQQEGMPAATPQRSDIPQQANMFPMQSQTPNMVPGQGQAFYIQPEENGDFPENP